MIKLNAIYPNEVQERALEIYQGLKEAGYTKDVNNNLLVENLCIFFLNKWLAGDDLYITEEECDEIYGCTGIDGGIQDLIDQGLLGSIEDENGEEILFQTEKGKKLGYGF